MNDHFSHHRRASPLRHEKLSLLAANRCTVRQFKETRIPLAVKNTGAVK